MSITNTQTRSLKIGFIGLGDQGGPMAHAIGAAGFSLHVWARRPKSLNALQGIPHTAHTTLSGLAGVCEIVALCLRDDSDIRDLLYRQGLLEALNPGTIVVNHGTGDPDENRRLAAELDALGVFYLDAPVSGGRPGALSRTLTTIVGGNRAAFDRCSAVFDSFSKLSTYMGASGSGQMAKLLNNALTMSNLKNAVDIFDLAEKLEMDLAVLFEMVSASSGSSFILKSLKTSISPEIAPHLQALMRKDIEHFDKAVRNRGFDSVELHARGLGGADGLVDLCNRISGHQQKDPQLVVTD